MISFFMPATLVADPAGPPGELSVASCERQ